MKSLGCQIDSLSSPIDSLYVIWVAGVLYWFTIRLNYCVLDWVTCHGSILPLCPTDSVICNWLTFVSDWFASVLDWNTLLWAWFSSASNWFTRVSEYVTLVSNRFGSGWDWFPRGLDSIASASDSFTTTKTRINFVPDWIASVSTRFKLLDW